MSLKLEATKEDGSGATFLILGDSNADYWDREYEGSPLNPPRTDEYCLPEGGVSSCAADVFNGTWNLGIGGSTCYGVNAALDDIIASMKTGCDGNCKKSELDHIMLVCGENDMSALGGCGYLGTYGESPENVIAEFKATIQKMIDGWEAGAQPRIFAASTWREPKVQETPALFEKWQKFDELQLAYAKELAKKSPASPPLTIINMAGTFVDVGNGKDLYNKDDIHLSPKGYALVNNAVKAAMEGDRACVQWKSDACQYKEMPSSAVEVEL